MTTKVTQSVNDVSTNCQQSVNGGACELLSTVSGELLAVVPEELLLKLPSSAILVFVSTLLTHR